MTVGAPWSPRLAAVRGAMYSSPTARSAEQYEASVSTSSCRARCRLRHLGRTGVRTNMTPAKGVFSSWWSGKTSDPRGTRGPELYPHLTPTLTLHALLTHDHTHTRAHTHTHPHGPRGLAFIVARVGRSLRRGTRVLEHSRGRGGRVCGCLCLCVLCVTCGCLFFLVDAFGCMYGHLGARVSVW